MLNFPDLGAQSSKSHSPILLFPHSGRLSPTPFGAHIFSWWGGGGTRGLDCSVLCDGHFPNSPSLGWYPPPPPLELIRPKTSKLSILAWTCASLFRHLNFQKWSEHEVFWTFWLGNVLRAITACNFSFLTLLFEPPGATNHWKNTVFRDFPTFSRTCIFFLLTLSLLWSSLFCSSLFYSSLLSGSSHLCCSSVKIVGSLTSKLPSIIMYHIFNIS